MDAIVSGVRMSTDAGDHRQKGRWRLSPSHHLVAEAAQLAGGIIHLSSAGLDLAGAPRTVRTDQDRVHLQTRVIAVVEQARVEGAPVLDQIAQAQGAWVLGAAARPSMRWLTLSRERRTATTRAPSEHGAPSSHSPLMSSVLHVVHLPGTWPTLRPFRIHLPGNDVASITELGFHSQTTPQGLDVTPQCVHLAVIDVPSLDLGDTVLADT